MAKHHVKQILDVLGREVLERKAGVTERSLKHAIHSGGFAGGRYRSILEACKEHDFAPSLDAFHWKDPAKKFGDGVAVVQGTGQENLNQQVSQ